MLRAEETKKKNWKNAAEASVVSTNGNSKASSYSAKETYNYDWTKLGLELGGYALKSDSNGVRTAEKYNANQKLTYNFTKKQYAYQRFLWERNTFAGIEHRYDASVGMGRELLETAKDLINSELGVGYINEQRTVPPRKDFASARAFAKYVHKLSETGNFSQTAEYLQSMQFGDDFRVNTESALTSALSTNLSLKLSYIWNYVSKPPVGYGRNDTTTIMALVVNY